MRSYPATQGLSRGTSIVSVSFTCDSKLSHPLWTATVRCSHFFLTCSSSDRVHDDWARVCCWPRSTESVTNRTRSLRQLCKVRCCENLATNTFPSSSPAPILLPSITPPAFSFDSPCSCSLLLATPHRAVTGGRARRQGKFREGGAHEGALQQLWPRGKGEMQAGDDDGDGGRIGAHRHLLPPASSQVLTPMGKRGHRLCCTASSSGVGCGDQRRERRSRAASIFFFLAHR